MCVFILMKLNLALKKGDYDKIDIGTLAMIFNMQNYRELLYEMK